MTEVLKPFCSDNPVVRIIKAQQLETQLNRLAEVNPQFEFFVYLVNRHCKRFVFPEDVLSLCALLQIETMQDLFNWTKTVDSSVIMAIIEPKLVFDLKVEKSREQIREAIEEFCACEKYCKWNFGDRFYNLPSKEDLTEILDKCPIDKRNFIVDGFDCDDFARTTKSWCTLHALGSVAFGYAEVNFYNSNEFLFAHAINIVPLVDERIVFVEPQKDSIWEADKPQFGFGADTMRLRFVQF